MGVAEVVGFAVCWLVVAGLMLWGVFTKEARARCGSSRRPAPPPPGTPAGRRAPRRATGSWWKWPRVPRPEVAEQARFLAAAWLASRGIDMAAVPPADVRTEVTTTGDGASTTRVLVRAASLQASRRHR